MEDTQTMAQTPEPEGRWIGVAELRSRIADTLNRVAYGGEHVILHRRGKPTAALVSMEDLELLAWAEDQRWAELAQQAERESDASGEPDAPLEQVEREIDIDRRQRPTRKAG